MPELFTDQGGGLNRAVRPMSAASRYDINPSAVVVVSLSPINRVVVTRIAERCGLKAFGVEPSVAEQLISSERPATIILDGGADNHECDGLVPLLAAARGGDAGPAVILLTTTTRMPENVEVSDVVDTVVAKPITPEALQPRLVQLRDRARLMAG